jgi:hypothetical protein
MEFRVRLDCYVTIGDRIRESVAERLSSPPGGGPQITEANAAEVIGRYRRLLQVVLGNWWYTDWAVRAYLARHLETTVEVTLYDAGIEEEDEGEMLPLILGRLGEEDADFFRGICDERWLLGFLVFT